MLPGSHGSGQRPRKSEHDGWCIYNDDGAKRRPDGLLRQRSESNSAPEATGTTNAGYCLTRSGHEHPGQMFVWNAYASLEDAMQALLKYDPTRP